MKPLEPWQDDPWHVEAECFWKGLAPRLKESLCWSRAGLDTAACAQVQPVWRFNGHKLFYATYDPKKCTKTDAWRKSSLTIQLLFPQTGLIWVFVGLFLANTVYLWWGEFPALWGVHSNQPSYSPAIFACDHQDMMISIFSLLNWIHGTPLTQFQNGLLESNQYLPIYS